ncbi:MAG: GNAT family N-acetyltransferase [bacterium]
MATDTLSLIPAGPEHAALWYAWRNEPATRRFNPVDPLTADDLADRMVRIGHHLEDETHTDFRWMVQRTDGVLIGTVAIKDVRWRMRYGEIAYGLGAEYHGRGYGTESVRLLVGKIFAESRLERLFAFIAAENIASRRIVEKLGFTHEGTMRKHFVIDGTRTDEAIYGLLRGEWT